MPGNRKLEALAARYFLAFGLAVVAQFVRVLFHVPPSAAFITYAPFVVASASVEGLGAGLVTTLFCSLEALFFVTEPLHSLDLADWDRLGGLCLTGVVASVLSERLNRSSQQMAEAHRKTRLILESISDGFNIFDRDWRYTYVNAAAAKMLGKAPQELLGKNLWELWPHAADSPFGVAYRRAVAENVPVQVEAFYPEPLNAWFEVRCYPSPEGLSLFFANTTGRKRAEDTFRLLSSIVECSDDAIISKNLDGVILSWNKGAERIYGYTEAEAVGRPTSFLIAPGCDNEFPKVVVDLKLGKRIEHYETERIRKDGRRISVSLTLSPLREEGRIVGASVIARDITERKQDEEEIRRLNQNLERRVVERTAQWEASNQELEAFAYSVSHDLRAPLRAIDGFSRILLDDHAPQLSEEARRYLNIVRKNAVQMGELIDDLLAFSRLSRQPLKKASVDMQALVRAVLGDLAREHEGRRVEISNGDLPPCEADPALLKQVLANLLANALKYTRQRDPARIEIGAMPQAGNPQGVTVYFVRDNGAGFDMQYAGKLFGVFQRLHRAEEYEGTGVGLALVHRIISRHGGQVWAEAAVDQGATFYFTLAGARQKPVAEPKSWLMSA